jgi:TonB family protein
MGPLHFVAVWILAGVAPTAAGAQALNEEYPTEALEKREQGIVLVDLTVGSNGRVSDCDVLVSPGFAALTAATCDAFRTRGRFKPAQDDRGRPMSSNLKAKVTWIIPGCATPKQEDPRLKTEVAVHGVITSSERC